MAPDPHSLRSDPTDLAALRGPLDAEHLRDALVAATGPAAFYQRIDVVEETGSTNADLLAVAGEGAAPRALLAEFQTGGRGRHSRRFEGIPNAQVITSVLLTLPGVDLADLGWLPLLAGIATVDTVRSVTNVPAELKWPNDVLVDGRKVAGILVEIAATTPVPAVVVGIGLNVTLAEDELPVPNATSLLLAGATELDRTRLAQVLLTNLAERMRRWRDHGWDPAALADAYRERCSTVGQRVRAVLPGDTELHGVAVDVDEQGRIVIRPDSASEPVAIAAGDITHLRPVG
ncbi:biotin--[acetyl-CoA-carboxylase] ligase [Rhodococcus zopfii]|uniref:biotin--[biotin carboxyl-carrier protein] ligase n=1 Tax=Rhodococcus zopfii TaxID=43772 RepID=A0ABU3WLP2_9NOCA|nr:biotin--[acetyl-CoA-carboxylase] ligase [Rhodococcus zopfii]